MLPSFVTTGCLIHPTKVFFC